MSRLQDLRVEGNRKVVRSLLSIILETPETRANHPGPFYGIRAVRNAILALNETHDQAALELLPPLRTNPEYSGLLDVLPSGASLQTSAVLAEMVAMVFDKKELYRERAFEALAAMKDPAAIRAIIRQEQEGNNVTASR